ncbi:helix-turn-helix domain-containing protein [Streptomyces apocyni]|uniref:helix-turn-helix domain-containing protein n=1 Tax=Streptomyces apocyni TaxID=2654677 RepID=UPI0018D18322|nr:helix-turn-helix transcriptional regulator [Streptomyces apocyni]
MAKPKRLDPSMSPRAMYGAELRFQREKAGLSQDELGAPLFVSGSFIGQLETSQRRMRPEYAVKIDEILKTDGFFMRNLEAGRKSRYPEHYADAAEYEALAREIREFAPVLIPGLLQTPAYAEAIFRAYNPVAPQEAIDKLLSARLDRANLLDHPTQPLFWAVLDESVLRRSVGGRAAMAEQLRHIAALIRRNRIIIQVLPFREGAHAAMGGSIKLMTFNDAPPMAYVQAAETGRLLDDPPLVARMTLTYDLLGAAALSPDASLALIETAAEEYEHGQQARSDGRDLA